MNTVKKPISEMMAGATIEIPQSSERSFRESFIKAKRAFKPLFKKEDNPFFKSKYADLAGIHAAVDEALLANDFTIHQILECAGDGLNLLTTKLCHIDGFEETSTIHLKTKDDTDPQKVKSCMTYMRRCSLEALLGIAASDDDDGNHASQSNTNAPQAASKSKSEYRMGIPKNRDLGKTLDEMGVLEVQSSYNYWTSRVKGEGKSASGAVKDFLEAAKAYLTHMQTMKGHKDFDHPDEEPPYNADDMPNSFT